MSLPSTETHHSLPPRPKYPLGEPTHPLSYQHRPDDNRRQHSAVGQPSHARPSLDKSDTLFGTAVTSIRKRSSDYVFEGGKRVRRSGEEGMQSEEGTRVVMGAMEDDTPLKVRDAPSNHRNVPPSPTSPTAAFTVTLSDTPHSEHPLAFLKERNNAKYHMSFSTGNNPPPTPRTVPVTCTPPIEMTKVLEFLLSPLQNVQQRALGLSDSIPLNQKQALADLKRKMSTMEEEAASSKKKVSGLEKDLSTTSEKYNKLKIGHEKWKVEMIKSFNRKLEVVEEGHKSVIETAKRQHAAEREDEIEKKVKEMEDRHTSEIEKIIEEVYAERDSQEEKRKKELECSFEKRGDEMKKQHRQEKEREIESLTAQWDLKLEKQKEEVKGWRDQAEDLLSERDRYRRERDVLEMERDTYRRERDQSSVEKEVLSTEKSELEAELETCQQKTQALQQQLIELESIVKSKDGEVYCLELENEGLEKSIETTDKEMCQLKRDITRLEDRSNTLNNENTALLSALQTLSTQSELLLSSETSLKAQLEEKKVSTQLRQTRLGDEHTLNQSLQAQLASLTSENLSKDAQVAMLELELKVSRSEITKNDSIIGSLTDEVLRLTDEKNELQNQLDAYVHSKAQAESLSLEKSELETQLASLVHEKQQLQDTYDKLVLNKGDLQTRLVAIAVKNEQLTKQVECLSSKQVELESQLAASNMRCAEYSATQRRHEGSISVLKQEAEEARSSMIESLELKKCLEIDKRSLEKEVARLKINLSKLETRLSQTPTPSRGSARSSEELESLRKDRSRMRLLEEEREGFWTQINDLEEENGRLRNQLRVYKEEDEDDMEEEDEDDDKEDEEDDIDEDDDEEDEAEEDDDMEDQITQMRDSYARLQLSHGEMTRLYTSLKVSYNELIDSFKQLQNTVQVMKIEQVALTAQIDSLTHRNSSLEQELKSSRKLCDELKKDLKVRPSLTVKLPSTKLLEKRLENSEQRVTNLRLEVAAKEDELEKAKEMRKALDGRINALDRSNKDKDRRLDSMRSRTKDPAEDRWKMIVEGKDRDIQNHKESLEAALAEVEKLKDLLVEKEGIINTLKEDLAGFQSSLKQMIPAFNNMTKNQMDNLIEHFSSGSSTSSGESATSKSRLVPDHQLLHTTLIGIRKSQGESSSIRRDIHEIVSLRSKRLEDLMIDHQRMGNSIGYNVAMRDHDHCSKVLEMLGEMGEAEGRMRVLLDRIDDGGQRE